MKLFYKNCILAITDDCAASNIRKIGLNYIDILKCVQNSFNESNGDSYLGDNFILSSERDKQRKTGVNTFPNIYINDTLYQGTLSADDLLLSVCSALNDVTLNCKNLDLDEEDNLDIFQIILTLIIIFSICIILLALICKRIVKAKYEKELNEAVNKFVVEYSVVKSEKNNY